jgi:hypothetical protein
MSIYFSFVSFFWESEKNKITFLKLVIFIRLNFATLSMNLLLLKTKSYIMLK